MKIFTTLTVLLCLTVGMGAEEDSIDTSIVFKSSQAYLDIKKRNPDQKHLLMEDLRSPEWVQIAIVEDHPTHVVALERVRVYANGRIERLVLKDDGEEAWIADNRPDKIQSEQGGTGQPATRPESKSEGKNKPQPESEGRSQ